MKEYFDGLLNYETWEIFNKLTKIFEESQNYSKINRWEIRYESG